MRRTLNWNKALLVTSCATALVSSVTAAHAVSSAELYTQAAYQYGRFEARMWLAGGDGVVSSFFLWKDRSEQSNVFWNELDFEKLGADCYMETNALYGMPEMSNNERHDLALDMCGRFYTYTYEWTPDYIAWYIDGVEIRRDTGASAAAFRDNTSQGMQLRFNVWPGDESFGGNFDPAILPVRQYIDWVQYSRYSNGDFQMAWREDFNGNGVPSGWLTGSWPSPKNRSTHSPANVQFIGGYAVLSVTADNATGSAVSPPVDPGDAPRPVPSEQPAEPDPPGPVEEPTVPGSGGAGGMDLPVPEEPSPSEPVAPAPTATPEPTTAPTSTPTPTQPVQPAPQGPAPSAPVEAPGTQPVGVEVPTTPTTPANGSGGANDGSSQPPQNGPGEAISSEAGSDDEGGCGCRVAGSPSRGGWSWWVLGFGLLFSRRAHRIVLNRRS